MKSVHSRQLNQHDLLIARAVFDLIAFIGDRPTGECYFEFEGGMNIEPFQEVPGEVRAIVRATSWPKSRFILCRAFIGKWQDLNHTKTEVDVFHPGAPYHGIKVIITHDLRGCRYEVPHMDTHPAAKFFAKRFEDFKTTVLPAA